MTSTPGQTLRYSVRAAFSDGFAAPLALLAMFVLLVMRGVWLLPDGYDGESGLNVTFGLLLTISCIALLARAAQPTSRLATAILTLCLFFLLSLLSSLAAAASAIGGGEFVDPWLHAVDEFLFPFYDWKAVALELPNYPRLYWLLNHNYDALNWQPLAFIIVTAIIGNLRDQSAFVTAWGLGLLGCILPFHWFPALSPYAYYGIGREDLPGHMVGLPWSFIPVLEGMRDGGIRAIELQCLTGMVTIPSFHACAATILAWSFWRYRVLRWPFVALNVGMALAAVPIGSHYIIDIVAGVAVGLFAAAAATALVGRRPVATAVSEIPTGVLHPA